jgi:16S rRNA (uracil1498-N3)-methyltransferase
MTRRRWIADSWSDTTATIRGDRARHLARVLRAEPGMEFDVLAGGRAWRSRIASVRPDSVEFLLIEELAAGRPLPVTLLLSIFKFDRMEWAIEKAVELGVARIVPLVAERTEKHLAAAAARRVERWRRIAAEAAQQSRRGDVPAIDPPERLTERVAGKQAPASVRVLLSETEEDQTLLHILGGRRPDPAGDISLAIGPEGGWTAGEMARFEQSGWLAATLGPRILRVETAAIAALAVAAAALGEDAQAARMPDSG